MIDVIELNGLSYVNNQHSQVGNQKEKMRYILCLFHVFNTTQ